jgi:hypothetical protein
MDNEKNNPFKPTKRVVSSTDIEAKRRKEERKAQIKAAKMAEKEARAARKVTKRRAADKRAQAAADAAEAASTGRVDNTPVDFDMAAATDAAVAAGAEAATDVEAVIVPGAATGAVVDVPGYAQSLTSAGAADASFATATDGYNATVTTGTSTRASRKASRRAAAAAAAASPAAGSAAGSAATGSDPTATGSSSAKPSSRSQRSQQREQRAWDLFTRRRIVTLIVIILAFDVLLIGAMFLLGPSSPFRPDTPAGDGAIIVAEQNANYNKDGVISEVVYGNNLTFEYLASAPETKITIVSTSSLKSIGNNNYLGKNNGNVVLYDRTAIARVIQFNVDWVAYTKAAYADPNNAAQAFADTLARDVKSGSKAEYNIQLLAGGNQVVFHRLVIGEIRLSGSNAYVLVETDYWTQGSGSYSTHTDFYLYKLVPQNGTLVISNFELISPAIYNMPGTEGATTDTAANAAANDTTDTATATESTESSESTEADNPEENPEPGSEDTATDSTADEGAEGAEGAAPEASEPDYENTE